MRKHVSLIIIIFLAGCASGQGGMFGPGKFEVVKADSRFSNNKDAIYTSMNNRVSSKSIAGGMHIDGSGVFINPMAVKNIEDGSVKSIALSIENMTSHDTSYGSPNTLGTIKTISFLINNQNPLVLQVKSGSTEWSDVISYNSVTRSASADIVESGIAGLTEAQYKSILVSTSLAIKVEGSKRSVVYETKDISKTFMANLREFYTNYVMRKEA